VLALRWVLDADLELLQSILNISKYHNDDHIDFNTDDKEVRFGPRTATTTTTKTLASKDDDEDNSWNNPWT